MAATTVVLALTGSLWVGTAAAEVDGERAGSVTVVDLDGEPLDHGASQTPFTLALPSGAACPGDSANGGYRIQSFVVPDGTDPGHLTYESTKPAGEGLWALYAVTSDPFVQGLTAVSLEPDDPGLIDGLPALDFAVFPPGTLAEGVNHVGIACTLFNETVLYWDTEIVLTNTPADTPAQLTWAVGGAPAGTSSSSSRPLRFVLAVLVLVVIVGAVVLNRRRRHSASRPKENSQ
jgi:hypothetical protein